MAGPTRTLPSRVRQGDAVALVSPSWFAAGAFPHRVERAAAPTSNRSDCGCARARRPGGGWRWLRPGSASGPIVGGCLETPCWHVMGLPEWPAIDGAILLLETSEEAPSPATVAAYLTDLDRLGVFDAIAGLVVARPANYASGDIDVLWDVVARATSERRYPVLANVDCGHTDPMPTVPLGVEARLDSATGTFTTLAAPTRAG